MSEQAATAEQSISGTPRLGPDDINEILRTFAASGWAGMRLDVGDVTIAVGKDGPPPESASTQPRDAAAPPAPVPSQVAPTAAPFTTTARAVAAPTAPTPVTPGPRVPNSTGEVELDETGLISVTSPTVGAFWVAPDPGSPPFVAVGDTVSAGDQLGIVEVMKLMNPVVTDVSGAVVAIRAANADMVEFGQTLFLIRPHE